MNTPERDSDTQALTDEDVFSEVAERLRLAEQAESQNRVNAIDALRFEDGEQWPQDINNSRKLNNRPALVINHTKTFVRRIVNNIKQQRPRIKVHPTGDGARMEDAEVIGGLIRHIEARSQASVAYDTGAESSVKIGWGYARVLGEYIDEKSFDQELKIVPVQNTLTVYIDPSSVLPDGSDAKWFIITEKMKRSEFKRKYPKHKLSDFERGAAGDTYSDWENKEEIRLAEYYRIKETSEWLYKMSDGSSMLQSELPSEESMRLSGLGFARDPMGNVVRRKTEIKTPEWFRLNGIKVVDKRTLPGKWLPVVRFLGNWVNINGQVRISGMIRDLMDPARMYNYWRTSQTESIALAPKAPWIMAEGQADGHPEWDLANTHPYSRLIYKPVEMNGTVLPPPQRTETVQIPAGYVDAAQSAEHDLMAVAGMPHEPGQDKPGEVVSGIALRRRQALSDISHFQYYDNQTLAIAQVGRILLDYIPYYYDTPRMQRIIGEDGVPETVGINQPQAMQQDSAIARIKNDLTVGRYDVVMDTGPGYQTKLEESTEVMLALMETPLGEVITKLGADVVLRNIDVSGAQVLADRVAVQTPQGMETAMEQLPKQAQGIVKALYGQLQLAQQQVQALEQDLKHGLTKTLHQEATKLQIAKMADDTKIEDVHMRTATAVHDTNVRSHTARDVAEIQAGATLLNTHAEAAHEKEAAKQLLKSAEKAATDH